MSKGFRDRTTMGDEVTITVPADAKKTPRATRAFVTGPGHEPTDAEALAMAHALADALGFPKDEKPTK